MNIISIQVLEGNIKFHSVQQTKCFLHAFKESVRAFLHESYSHVFSPMLLRPGEQTQQTILAGAIGELLWKVRQISIRLFYVREDSGNKDAFSNGMLQNSFTPSPPN